MKEFVLGTDAQYEMLKQSLNDDRCHVYEKCTFPSSFSRPCGRIGFEKEQEGYALFIDKGLTCSCPAAEKLAEGWNTKISGLYRHEGVPAEPDLSLLKLLWEEDFMEELIGWVLLAIFVVAAGRVGYLIYQNNRHPEQAAASAATARRDPHGETGPMIYFANDAHGRADREYQFNYKWVYDGSLHAYTWRACILRMPSLCGRPSDGHTTHRWSDADGNHWVCWDSPVTSLTEMQSVSRLWADSVQEYIATGKRFG